MYTISMPPEIKIPNSSEIDQALKEFEMKSASAPQVPTAQSSSLSDDRPKMVRLVMKFGIKDERTAEFVLLGLVILMLAVSFYLFFGGTKVEVKSPTLDVINTPQPAEGFIPR